MASSYPSGLDSFDTIASDKKTSDSVGGRTHRAMHNDLGDAIEAVQTELGTDPAGGSATVKARFEVIEANDWVTSARIAADAVGSSELADNAVDTAAIANSAVTDAKLAGSITPSKVTGTALVASTVDAKGDLYVGTAGDTVARLAAGADGTLLGYDSTTTSGLATFKVGNLLTANQASGTDTLSATTGLSGIQNATIATTTDQALQGSRSLQATSNGSSPMKWGVPTGVYSVAVTPGEVMTFIVSIRSATDSRDAFAELYWFNGSTPISASVSPTVATSTSGWTTYTVTGVAPATTTQVRLAAAVNSPAASEVHYADAFGLWKGAGGVFAMPGSAIVHTGIRPNPSNTAEVQIWNDATASWITV